MTITAEFTQLWSGADVDPWVDEENFYMLNGTVKILDGGLRPLALKDSVVLHPVCSVHKMELVEAFEAVARQCATDVTRPIGAGCCGFAGDRGFSFPELTAAATRAEAAEVKSTEFSGYYSSSRTCEIGLSRATGQPYQSFWALLDEVTRP